MDIREDGRKKPPGYFEEALSDFVHDAASGGAIRHMVDMGYTTEQIMGRLDFPTPRTRVEKTVYKHMTDTGILLDELPLTGKELQTLVLKNPSEAELCSVLREHINRNGEEKSYISCPYGMVRRDREARLKGMLSCLTSREQEYILGLPLPAKMMYHRLNSRMLEIGVQLAVYSEMDVRFYFLDSRDAISVEMGRN